MRLSLIALFALAVSVSLVGCGGDPVELNLLGCVPGSMNECTCDGGAAGFQVCSGEGGYGDCRCGESVLILPPVVSCSTGDVCPCTVGVDMCSDGFECTEFDAGARCAPAEPDPGEVDATCVAVDDCSSDALCYAERCLPNCDPAAPACSVGRTCLPTSDAGGSCLRRCDVLDPVCFPDQGCYSATNGEICTAAGSLSAGAECQFVNDCQPGLLCLASLCLETCALDTGCDGGACLEVGEGFGGCFPECDLLDPECGPSMACYLVDGTATCAPPTDALPAGAGCAFANECAAGLVCVVETCRQLCEVEGARGCPESETCTPLEGYEPTGVCIPAR